MFKAGGTSVTCKIADNYDTSEFAVMGTSLKNPRHPLCMNNPKFIAGHFLFGIHRYLDQPFVYITFLRDPVDRLISVYYNIRESRCSGHPLHQLCTNLSFSEFVASSEPSVRIHVDNYQVRELTGLAMPDHADFWTCGEDLLRAQGNIQRFFGFIEFTENINTVLPALKKKFGWEKGPPEDLLMNVTQGKPSKIHESVREDIRRRNQLDYQLIEWVKAHKFGINT